MIGLVLLTLPHISPRVWWTMAAASMQGSILEAIDILGVTEDHAVSSRIFCENYTQLSKNTFKQVPKIFKKEAFKDARPSGVFSQLTNVGHLTLDEGSVVTVGLLPLHVGFVLFVNIENVSIFLTALFGIVELYAFQENLIVEIRVEFVGGHD